jgi:hypothetical protein
MLGNGMASADALEQQDAARVGARPKQDGRAPFPAFRPPSIQKCSEMVLTCSPNTPANIQACNCAATATSCGAAKIVPAVCPICHGDARGEIAPTSGVM